MNRILTRQQKADEMTKNKKINGYTKSQFGNSVEFFSVSIIIIIKKGTVNDSKTTQIRELNVPKSKRKCFESNQKLELSDNGVKTLKTH